MKEVIWAFYPYIQHQEQEMLPKNEIGMNSGNNVSPPLICQQDSAFIFSAGQPMFLRIVLGR